MLNVEANAVEGEIKTRDVGKKRFHTNGKIDNSVGLYERLGS